MSNKSNLNFGNSLFEGFNDQHGLIICGYEYGLSKADEQAEQQSPDIHFNDVTFTFANKVPFLGEHAKTFRYDNRIAKWFELWGHPLNREGLGDDFTKSIMQTNVSNTQNRSVEDYEALSEHFDSFIQLLNTLKPSVIFFMGAELSNTINQAERLAQIEAVLGQSQGKRIETAETDGTAFKVIFQDFEHCTTVTFPHPSGTVGLSDDYIASFKPQIDAILTAYKAKRGF
ncbi:MAG: hypothetical protein Q4D05_03935 [Acinetobacter sp.]|nr:hypothetical protein [Acinetobacter sp.]